MRNKIEHRPGLVKILDNIGWLFFDKVLRMGVGLLVGVWVARYLGPENFGLMNYAIAFTSLFGVIATLGLNEIMVRDFIILPKNANTILGTGFFLRLLGGLIAFLFIISTISFLRPNDTLAKTIVAIFGFTLIIQSSDVIKYWFESQIQSKFVVWVENGVFLVIAVVKVCMILLHASLLGFVFVGFFEVLLVSLLLILLYYKKIGRLTDWRPSYLKAKKLLHDSWPLVFSGLAVALFMKIDQIMLGQIMGDHEVGIYSAAARISEVWYFIPMIITSTLFPTILNSKNQSIILFYRRFSDLFRLLTLISLMFAIFISLYGNIVVNILYGVEYSSASRVLILHIWGGIFVSLGLAQGKYWIAQNLQKIQLFITVISAIMNIILNFILIPDFGAKGAALATVITLSVGTIVTPYLFKEARKIATITLLSMFLIPWKTRK